jgi:hypothetical protein
MKLYCRCKSLHSWYIYCFNILLHVKLDRRLVDPREQYDHGDEEKSPYAWGKYAVDYSVASHFCDLL